MTEPYPTGEALPSQLNHRPVPIVFNKCPACRRLEITGMRETTIPHHHPDPRARRSIRWVVFVVFAVIAGICWVGFLALLVWKRELTPFWRGHAIALLVMGSMGSYFAYISFHDWRETITEKSTRAQQNAR